MQHLIIQVADVIVPVLICVLFGFGLAKIKSPWDNKVINGLVANVGYPTLILAHLTAGHVKIDQFLDMMLGAVAVLVCFAVIGLVFLKLVRLPVRAFLSPMMHNNVGNVGLPVAYLAFGDAGLAYTMGFVVVVLISIFTIGMWLPMGRASFRDLAKSPIIYSVILALVLMATDTRLPKPIESSFTIMGGLAIPLMLLTLGHTLATLKVSSVWRGCYLSLFHIVMAVGVAWGLLHVFDFTETQRGVFILSCLMPVSVATYLFIDHHVPEHAPDVAGFILISTILTVFVLPFVLTYWV